MATLTPATGYVLKDEKAWLLHEGWSKTPLGLHRVQRIWVLRDDALAVYVTDMGPAERFPGMQRFQVPALWEYSVAELQEIADQIRGVKPPDDRPPTPLLEVYCQNLEEEAAQRAHRTVIGPAITIQR